MFFIGDGDLRLLFVPEARIGLLTIGEPVLIGLLLTTSKLADLTGLFATGEFAFICEVAVLYGEPLAGLPPKYIFFGEGFS